MTYEQELEQEQRQLALQLAISYGNQLNLDLAGILVAADSFFTFLNNDEVFTPDVD